MVQKNMEISYEAKLADRAEALKDFFGGDDKEATSVEKLELLDQFESLMIKYRAAVREVTTKLEVLNDELSSFAERNPIEGIQSRIKRPYSIAKKLKARGLPVAVESIQKNLNDVAGIRVICPFISDISDVADMLLSQEDVLLIEKKDYIEKPKENGYRSLHLIVEIPIFLSKGKENMRVEIQIRTVAMDFWASLEHQIRYKKGLEEGQKISEGLKECADTIARTDLRMQELREMIKNSV